jgi:hypothetical protein
MISKLLLVVEKHNSFDYIFIVLYLLRTVIDSINKFISRERWLLMSDFGVKADKLFILHFDIFCSLLVPNLLSIVDQYIYNFKSVLDIQGLAGL